MVVPRGVGELRARGGVAHRVHAFRARTVAVVHGDVATRVPLDARRLAAQVVRVRLAAQRDEHVRAAHLAPRQAHHDLCAFARQRFHLRREHEAQPLRLEHGAEGFRRRLVLVREQAVRPVDHRHLGPEPAEHLRELAPDVAAAEHHQVGRDLAELRHGTVVEGVHGLQAGDGGPRGAGADVDHHRRGAMARPPHVDLEGADEARVAAHQADPVSGGGQALLDALAPLPHDRILARDDGGEVDRHRTRAHTQLARAAGDVRGPGAGHHRLGGRAARVHAGAAQLLALGEQDPASGLGQARGQGHSRLSGADHDHVEVRGSCAHRPSRLSSGPSRAASHPRMRAISGGETSWPMGNSCHSAARPGRRWAANASRARATGTIGS